MRAKKARLNLGPEDIYTSSLSHMQIVLACAGVIIGFFGNTRIRQHVNSRVYAMYLHTSKSDFSNVMEETMFSSLERPMERPSIPSWAQFHFLSGRAEVFLSRTQTAGAALRAARRISGQFIDATLCNHEMPCFLCAGHSVARKQGSETHIVQHRQPQNVTSGTKLLEALCKSFFVCPPPRRSPLSLGMNGPAPRVHALHVTRAWRNIQDLIPSGLSEA